MMSNLKKKLVPAGLAAGAAVLTMKGIHEYHLASAPAAAGAVLALHLAAAYVCAALARVALLCWEPGAMRRDSARGLRGGVWALAATFSASTLITGWTQGPGALLAFGALEIAFVLFVCGLTLHLVREVLPHPR